MAAEPTYTSKASLVAWEQMETGYKHPQYGFWMYFVLFITADLIGVVAVGSFLKDG